MVAGQLSEELPQAVVAQSIRAIYPNIFDWLSIQNQTKIIVIIIMTAVAIINLITCLLILVMERTRMVGALKAFGLPDAGIRRIFWYYASWIAITGIGAGLFISLALLWLQQATGLIRMDEATYYVDRMPVKMVWWQVVAVVSGSFIVCVAALRLPLFFVNRISPVKALRFS
jgi:lipoprotein-releasing system permease protein